MARPLRLLAVLLGAVVGAAVVAGFFWVGRDYDASTLALAFWSLAGAGAGGAIAALVVLLDRAVGDADPTAGGGPMRQPKRRLDS